MTKREREGEIGGNGEEVILKFKIKCYICELKVEKIHTFRLS
jgi:hypothetical protein